MPLSKQVILFFPSSFPQSDQGKLARDSRKNCTPLSLLAIAAPLVKRGYAIKIINQSLQPDWRNILFDSFKNRPICIGISAMTGYQLNYALEVSEIVKQNSSIPVVWGGIHATILPQQTLENSFIDIVVEGEGEQTFLELVCALEKNSDMQHIPGLWYKKDGKIIKTPRRNFIDLNLFPSPSYDLLGEKDIDTIRLFTSRGCPHHCSYCYNTTVNQSVWRVLSAEEALRRIGLVVNDFKYLNHISFVDDEFFMDLKRARIILEGLVKFNISWSTHIRIDTLAKLDKDFLNLLDRSHCHHLLIGIESGSKRMLTIMQKEIDIAEVLITNQRICRHNFFCIYNFVIGIPTETLQDVKVTLNLVERLLADNKKAIKNFNVFAPYPGNRLFDMAIAYGFQPPSKLEDWADLNVKSVSSRTWLNKEMEAVIDMVLFCSLFLDPYRRFLMQANILEKLIYRAYRPIAIWRIKNLYTGIPLDIQLGNKLGYFG